MYSKDQQSQEVSSRFLKRNAAPILKFRSPVGDMIIIFKNIGTKVGRQVQVRLHVLTFILVLVYETSMKFFLVVSGM